MPFRTNMTRKYGSAHRALAVTLVAAALGANAGCASGDPEGRSGGEGSEQAATRPEVGGSEQALDGSTDSDSGPRFGVTESVAFARIAFSGTVVEMIEDPVADPGAAAEAREFAMVEVEEVLRGSLGRGSKIAVWYGTKLRPGPLVADGADPAITPKLGDHVLVLAEEIGKLGSYPQLVVPIGGGGLGVVESGRLTTITESGVDVMAILERLRSESAPEPVAES